MKRVYNTRAEVDTHSKSINQKANKQRKEHVNCLLRFGMAWHFFLIFIIFRFKFPLSNQSDRFY